MNLYVLLIILSLFYLTEAKIISTFKLRKIETDTDITTDEYIVSIDNKNHHLILKEFESNNYKTSVWFGGKPYKTIKHDKGTLMTGRLANDANSKIFLLVNDGLHGLLVLGNNTFEVKPIENLKKMKKMSRNSKSLLYNNHDHIAILHNEQKNHRLQCGNTGEQSIFSNYVKMKYYDPHFSINPKVRNVTKILSLSLVIPLEIFLDKRWGSGNVRRTIKAALLQTHTLNYLFTPFNMAVLVGHIEIFTDHKLLPAFVSPLKFGNILDMGVSMRKRFHDNGGLDFTATVIFSNYTDWAAVGLAFVNVMCASNNRLSASVVFIGDLVFTATVMAHEIGHNIGFYHSDQTKNPKCSCPKICIMNSGASIAGLDDFSWNTCDIDIVQNYWNQSCFQPLQNFKPIDKVFCGNNIVEPGEDCDCGLPSECSAKKQDKCCDAVSCKFYSPAECVDGPCCRDCKFLPKYTPCAIYSTECSNGICIGNPFHCELTNIKPNGTSCNNNMDMCFKGECIAHGSRCSSMFGNSGVVGNSKCHSYFNKRTDSSGNCGYNDSAQQFTKCGNNDYLCGKLICNTKILSHNDTSYTYEVNEQGCTAKYLTKVNKSFSNILMVNDGISCDFKKTCFDNKCLYSDQIIAYIAYKECGAYATISRDDDCICNSKYDVINFMCFLKKPTIQSVGIIITLLVLIQIFLISLSALFILQLFSSKNYQITTIKR